MDTLFIPSEARPLVTKTIAQEAWAIAFLLENYMHEEKIQKESKIESLLEMPDSDTCTC